MKDRLFLLGVLIVLGMGWGLTQPLIKIAVSGGYRHLGLIFWQFVIGGAFLALIVVFTGRDLPFGRKQIWFYVLIAIIGTLMPNAASYEAARVLPAGILSILISLVPMFAFPIALVLGTDRFSWSRLGGLSFGMAGVFLLVGPDASLPQKAMVAMIPLALIAPAFYGLEGNLVAKWGMFGCDPFQVLLGASLVGALLSGPMALASGTWIDPRPPWSLPDLALVLSSLIHAMTYTGYVWLVARAGAVFAAQVSYLVTGFGIAWAMLILSETYSSFIWAALALIFIGVFMVQPRRNESLDAVVSLGDDTGN